MQEQDSAFEDTALPGEAKTRNQPPLVVVVEDDDTLRKLLEIALTHQDYAVVTAANVQEAESALEQWGGESLVLVISDINLTQGCLNQDGYELYRRWRERCPHLPYLLISADPTNRSLPEIRNGDVPFMEKPFRIGALLDHLQALLGQPQADDHLNLSSPVATPNAMAFAGV